MVFANSPTSPLASSGTEETVTAPSSEASAVHHHTGKAQRDGDDLRPRPELEGAEQRHDAGS